MRELLDDLMREPSGKPFHVRVPSIVGGTGGRRADAGASRESSLPGVELAKLHHKAAGEAAGAGGGGGPARSAGPPRGRQRKRSGRRRSRGAPTARSRPRLRTQQVTGFDIPEIRAARVRRDNAPQKTETTAAIAELKREQGALEVDSDIVKERLPEYEGGVNAQGVHRESASIIEERVLPRALEAGDNIAVPRVGTRDNTITELVSDLKANGYTTHLVLVDLDPVKAAGRVTSRFLKKGRFVDLTYVLRTVGTKPAEVYARLKNDPGNRYV